MSRIFSKNSLRGILVTMITEEMSRPQTISRRECIPRYSRQLQTRRVQNLVKIPESSRGRVPKLYLQSNDNCEQPVGFRGSKENDGDWQGQGHHGVGGGHPELTVEPRLHPDHVWNPGPGPAEELLEGLADVESQHPHQEHPPPHHAVHVPDQEAVQEGVCHLLAQKSSKFEQVIPKFIVHLGKM